QLQALTEAQARTEQVVRALAEAQAGTDQRVASLEEAVARLTEAQARTDQTVQDLARQVQALTEAQARTEQQVQALTEAQARTEQQLQALAEAQARTDQRVASLEEAVARLTEAQARLAERMGELATQVGRLSDAVGFTLEELARELAPVYLEKHHGIHVPSFQQRFFTVDAEEVEVDFYGEGTRDGETVVVVGEARSRIYGRDVEALLRKVQLLSPLLPAHPLPVLFGFVIHPSAAQLAAQKGVLVFAPVGPHRF
ncbi:MAG: hypothetical protein QN124_12105, partial [Armatimonadota bacterium]|nr:hypothetical protein [Armatimonadota bacterium]